MNPSKKRVILIGIDGLLKRCMNEANITAFDYMVNHGSHTLKARTSIEASSGPGWSNILCGLDTEDTGIFDNEWRAPWMFLKKAKIDSITGPNPFPCVFSELKKNDPNLNIKVSWSWSWFLNIGSISIPNSIDKEDFCFPDPELNLSKSDKCDQEMIANAINNINEDFDFLFVFFGSVDKSGHIKKFCGPEYIDRIGKINNYVQMIFDELKKINIFDNTIIILTTDHGASYLQQWHGMQDNDNIQIPFYIMGPGIKKNYILKDYIKNVDITPTILHLFGFSLNRHWRSKIIADAFENYTSFNEENIKLKFLEYK